MCSLLKEHPPKIGIMQAKASGEGKTLPQKDEVAMG